ncbi:hypothetical protein LINGRAHAP2_LOCUS29006 [Linum grandiflorum]
MVGYPFTWARSKGTPRCIEERLDRCFVNESWSERYEVAVLRNLIAPVSDHSPIILSTEGLETHFSPRLFRFENAWLAEPSLRPLLQECWDSTMGQPLLMCLTECATTLNRWGRDLALRFRRDIRLTKRQMNLIERDLMSPLLPLSPHVGIDCCFSYNRRKPFGGSEQNIFGYPKETSTPNISMASLIDGRKESKWIDFEQMMAVGRKLMKLWQLWLKITLKLSLPRRAAMSGRLSRL